MAEVSNSPDGSKLTRVFSRTPSSWDPQDDLLLRHLKEQQKLGWKEIASHFAHRTPNACQFRWRRLRSGSLKSSTPAVTVTLTPASSATSTPTASSVASGSTPSAHKEPSTSPSASPPPVMMASSKPRSGTQPIAVPSYNQWSFKSENRGSSIRDENTDPLSSSLNSMSSNEELPITKVWTSEEDELLLARRKRELSLTELSILLPTRTEGEINGRITELETRSQSTSAIIDFRESTKLQYLSTTPQRSKRHSHSHTPTHRRKSERSFSVSSQTSVGSFMSSDIMRSNSFSYNPPALFNNVQQQAVSERYTLRKESISSQTTFSRPFKVRSNSIFRTSLATSVIDDEEDDEVLEKQKRQESGLPPLGVLFSEYFAK